MDNIPYFAIFGAILILLLFFFLNKDSGTGPGTGTSMRSGRNAVKWVDISKERPALEGVNSKGVEPNIPRKVFQTFKSTHLPERMAKAILHWRQVNPDYDFYYYDDADCIAFLEEHYDNRIVSAYQSLIPGAAKADLFRYCLLYKYGGIYLDIDMTSIKPLREIVGPNDDLVLSLDKDHGRRDIHNAFMAARPQHPLFKRAIDLSVDRILQSKSQHIFYLTGPKLLGDALERMPGTISRKIWYKHLDQEYSWGKLRLYRHFRQTIIDGDAKAVICSKYEGYLKDHNLVAGKHYTQLWLQTKNISGI